MTVRLNAALVLGLCSCTGPVRTTKLELIDSKGETVAEMERANDSTSLRFYEYSDGAKFTTLEMASHSVMVTRGAAGALREVGHSGEELQDELGRVVLSARSGSRSELSSDGITFFGKDGRVLWVVVVSNSNDGPPTLEFLDGRGKELFSTTSLK